MSGNVTELKPKQEEAIMALLSNRTVEDAARVVKITPRTLYRWLNEPGFDAAIRTSKACLVLTDWAAELRLLRCGRGMATVAPRLAHVRFYRDGLACRQMPPDAPRCPQVHPK